MSSENASPPTECLKSPDVPDGQQPSKTDLLIRSLSTILFLLWPEAERPQPRSESTRRLALNHLSLMFVPGFGVDAAAVSVAVYQDKVEVEAVQETNAVNGSPCLRVGVWGSREDNLSNEGNVDALRQELLSDPIKYCCNRGVAAISPSAHGVVLQTLLTALYQKHTCPISRKCEEYKALQRYVYIYCIGKIRQRFAAHIPNSGVEFLSLFLKWKDFASLTREEFGRRGCHVKRTTSLKEMDESWLYDLLALRYPEIDFGPKPIKNQTYRMDLTEARAWSIWSFFVSRLDTLNQDIKDVERESKGSVRSKEILTSQYTGRIDKSYSSEGVPNGSDIDIYVPMCITLDRIANNMSIIYRFVHRCAAFWGIVTSLSDILDARRGNAMSNPSASPTNGPQNPTSNSTQQAPLSDLNSAGSNCSAGGHPASPSLRPFREAQHDKPRNYPSDEEAYDSSADGDTHPKTMDSTNMLQLSGTPLQIQEWLSKLVQWHSALLDLSQGHLAAGIGQKELTIKVAMAPPPVEAYKQASLRETLEGAVGQDKVDDALKILAKRAKQKHPRPTRDSAKTLINAAQGNGSVLDHLETQFASSSVHCEAHSICTLPEHVARQGTIGITKRCCFSCAVLLRAKNIDEKILSPHGKIYPYPPPPNTTEDVKLEVLNALKTKLRVALISYSSRRRGDSTPGANAELTRNDEDSFDGYDLSEGSVLLEAGCAKWGVKLH